MRCRPRTVRWVLPLLRVGGLFASVGSLERRLRQRGEGLRNVQYFGAVVGNVAAALECKMARLHSIVVVVAVPFGSIVASFA